MFFKRNKNQESTDVDVNQVQGKHETDTRYLVKLDNGQYVNKDYYDGTVNQGTSDLYHYYIYDLKDAKRTQRDFGGEIYEVVTDTCIRPYQGKPRKTGGHVSNHDESEIGDRPEAVIKQSKHVTFIPRNSNIKLPDEFLIDGVKYSKHVNKPHVNADMATDVRLDNDELVKSINALTKALSAVPRHEDNADKEHHPKIHELSNQPLVAYASDGSINYVWDSSDCEILELLSKSNTRLAIIEDDHA